MRNEGDTWHTGGIVSICKKEEGRTSTNVRVQKVVRSSQGPSSDLALGQFGELAFAYVSVHLVRALVRH